MHMPPLPEGFQLLLIHVVLVPENHMVVEPSAAPAGSQLGAVDIAQRVLVVLAVLPIPAHGLAPVLPGFLPALREERIIVCERHPPVAREEIRARQHQKLFIAGFQVCLLLVFGGNADRPPPGVGGRIAGRVERLPDDPPGSHGAEDLDPLTPYPQARRRKNTV